MSSPPADASFPNDYVESDGENDFMDLVDVPSNPGLTNPDPSNPDPSNPDPSIPDPSNPDPSNPGWRAIGNAPAYWYASRTLSRLLESLDTTAEPVRRWYDTLKSIETLTASYRGRSPFTFVDTTKGQERIWEKWEKRDQTERGKVSKLPTNDTKAHTKRLRTKLWRLRVAKIYSIFDNVGYIE